MTDSDIAGHAIAFRSSLSAKLTANIQLAVANSADKLDEAYARMTCLQAWRASVMEAALPSSSLGFYSEAQNDGLTSIVLVSSGLWRPSLKSLRSLVENMLHAFYYMDHPVEYLHWENGTQRPTFQKLFEYFETHPSVAGLSAAINPVAQLKKHYSHLSNVVHSSAKELRMTDDFNQSNLWKSDVASIGQWASTQTNVLRDVNLLTLALFKDHVQGAAHKSLRESLSYVIPSARDEKIKNELGVRIIR